MRASVGVGRKNVKKGPAHRRLFTPGAAAAEVRAKIRVLSYARIRQALPRRFVIHALTVNSVTPTSPPHVPSASPDPVSLVLGIGCRRGVTLAQIEHAVQAALADEPLARVAAVATLDAKADEPALLAFCAAHRLPLRAYGREAISAMPTQAAPSGAVQARFGVDGVCEPCAQLAAGGGPLKRGKLALDGVTVALAVTR